MDKNGRLNRNEEVQIMIALQFLQRAIGAWAVDKQFQTPGEPVNHDQKLLLIVSEICEAQDELRNGRKPHDLYYEGENKPCGYGVELADAVIRIFQLAANADLPLADLIIEKLAYNCMRPVKHNRQF